MLEHQILACACIRPADAVSVVGGCKQVCPKLALHKHAGVAETV